MLREPSTHTSFMFLKFPGTDRYSALDDTNEADMCRFHEDGIFMCTLFSQHQIEHKVLCLPTLF